MKAASPIPLDQILRQKLIDEFGELDRQVKQFAPTAKRHEAIAKEIRSWYVNHPAEQGALAEGTLYEVQVSARGEERQFSLKAKLQILKELGRAKAMALFTITLKAAEEALGAARVAQLVQLERTASRKLVVVARQAAQVQQAA